MEKTIKSRVSGFDKLEMIEICKMLSDIAIIENNKEMFLHFLPLDDLNLIEDMLTKTDEALGIIRRYERAPLMIFNNYLDLLDIAKKGGVLSGLELYETIRLNTTIKANNKQLAGLIKEQIPCPNYEEMVNELYLLEDLDQKLNKTVDETGFVLDDASPLLRSIRSKLRNIDARIKSKINEILAKDGSKLAESYVTMRNDRYCLAVKAEYKNSFKGIAHDVSGSYQTFYIEPLAVVELTSEKEQLINDEKQEVERILRLLSNEIGDNEAILRSSFNTIITIDDIFTRAMLANRFDANKPHLNTSGYLNLVNARHPLLKVKKVIPNNISFGNKKKSYQGIVITGPNTGGKTVLLKTVGLLSLMVKYGLLIPADASSDVMIYDQIFCDIGDDQSIENNLSTFSSHMNNIVSIIDNVTPNSLVLLDEVGSGTDPVEGSNLAMAILKHFINYHINFITTTHYSALKAFAFDNELIVNASMEFDDNSLAPTYKLILGVSGASNAFNIASRLGLKKEIIEDAKKMTATTSDDTRGLILKLERRVKEMAEEKKALEELINKQKETNLLLQKEYQSIDNEKKKILDKAQKDADELVSKTKMNAEAIIDKLKKMEKKDNKLHEIIEAKEELKKIDDFEIKKDKTPAVNEIVNLNVGDDVYIYPYDQYGVINKMLKNGEYSVSIGNIVANFSRNELKLVKEEIINRKGAVNKVTFTKPSVKLTLDLRGCRYEEAKDLLDKYIDDLVVSNIQQATIIHGYGTGVIRELVKSYIHSCPHIASSRYGGEGEGGFGVTIITLK